MYHFLFLAFKKSILTLTFWMLPYVKTKVMNQPECKIKNWIHPKRWDAANCIPEISLFYFFSVAISWPILCINVRKLLPWILGLRSLLDSLIIISVTLREFSFFPFFFFIFFFDHHMFGVRINLAFVCLENLYSICKDLYVKKSAKYLEVFGP